MPKIAFLVDNYFEQVEYTEARDTLEEHGHTTFLIAAYERTVTGVEHDIQPKDTFDADLLLSQANFHDFDALVIVGGTINADRLRINPEAQKFVTDFLEADRLVAAICHATWLLISSGVVKGKNITAYKSLKDDVINAGANYIDQPMVQDGDLITSRQPDDIPAFTQAIDEFFIKHDSR